jgi:hypothetical protein
MCDIKYFALYMLYVRYLSNDICKSNVTYYVREHIIYTARVIINWALIDVP